MKVKLLIVAIVLLSACNDAIPQWVIDAAAHNCGSKEKVHQIFYDAKVNSGSVTCKNGIYYSISLREDK